MPHTKAPFRKVRYAAHVALGGYKILGADYTFVGITMGGLGDEGEANARLFELAPQLLTALQDAYACLNSLTPPCLPKCACPLHAIKQLLNQAEAR